MYRVGGPRETDTTVLKTANMYTLMKRKTDIQSKQNMQMYTRHHTVSSTATQTQLGNVTSRVTPHRAIVTAPPSVHWSAHRKFRRWTRILVAPTTRETAAVFTAARKLLLPLQQLKHADEAATTRLLGHDLVPQLRESLYATTNITERLSQEIRRRINRQHRHLTIQSSIVFYVTFTWDRSTLTVLPPTTTDRLTDWL